VVVLSSDPDRNLQVEVGRYYLCGNAPILPVAEAVKRAESGGEGLGPRVVFVIDEIDGRPTVPIPAPLRRRYRPVRTWNVPNLILSDEDRRAADPRLDGYRTPPGWRVEVAATEPLVINPVTMSWGPDARLYVIEWTPGAGPNDRVKVLTDVDGDGQFDRADIYLDRLEMPAGILLWDGWTYLTLGHDVVRWRDRDGDGNFETRQVVATGFGNDDSHHRVSGMTIGPDGWLYLTTGDSDARARGSDGSEATVLRSGGVFRCKPDGSRLEVVAFGMRNPWGNVCFNSRFNIFHTDNDNEGAWGFSGCRLLHVVEGGDYGWRLREGALCCQPDYERATWEGGRPGRLGPIDGTGRGAPTGLCCLDSAAFPPSTRDLLIYPDVFRKLVRAYELKPAGATFAVDREIELLSSDDPLFRPDDAEVGPDGALYVLDWRTDSGGAGQHWGNGKTGRIYRMTWSGTDQEPARKTFPHDRFARLAAAEPEALGEALKSDDGVTRRAASLEILRRRDEIGRRALEQGARFEAKAWPLAFAKVLEASKAAAGRDHRGIAVRNRHLAGISAPNSGSPLMIESALRDLIKYRQDDATTRRIVIEAVGRFADIDDPVLAVRLLDALERSGKDGAVVRSVAQALGHLGGLPRARPGQETNWAVIHKEYIRESREVYNRAERRAGVAGASGGGPKLDPDDHKRLDKLDSWLVRQMTAELIARRLLDLGAESTEADPFLRDGITRGLERLGPAGLDAVLKDIGSTDAKTAQAALFVLQGWRSIQDLDAILAVATGPRPIPSIVRANLFRCLREMKDAVPVEPIVRWLRTEGCRGGEPAAVALKVLVAMGPRASREPVPILPGLFRAEGDEVRRAAIELAGAARSPEAEKALVALVEDDKAEMDDRRKGLEELRKYADHKLAPGLANLFDAARHPGLRSDVLRTLAPLDFAAAAGRAKVALNEPDQALRHEAIALLGQRPETALAVTALYNAGKVPREDLPRVIEAVRSHATPELQAATQALLKKTLLAAPEGAEAQRLREFVRRNGNPRRGRGLFLDAKKGNCASCHRLEGVGNALGPDLTRVWQTLSFEKRAESILDPSKEIKEGYRTLKVATTDGRVVTGLLVADKADSVTLKDAQGREVTIPAAEVDQKGPDATSLMPAGAAGNLSLNDLADLLAFLGDREMQESLKAGD
jgi:putative membrane-bound dehydrogenase-like protein